MASYTLYPPIVDSYMPAFPQQDGQLKIYYDLSKFNVSTDYSSLHATVCDVTTGASVVNLSDSNGHYRKTGIILDLKKDSNDNFITILNNDIKNGFQAGHIYKIQLRLSEIDYADATPGTGQSDWLGSNAGRFSEWSTVCVVTCFNQIAFELSSLGVSDINHVNTKTAPEYKSNILLLTGNFTSSPESESIVYYGFILYDNNNVELERTGNLYLNGSKSFNITLNTELENSREQPEVYESQYKLKFYYKTKNLFEGGIDILTFTVNYDTTAAIPNCNILTAETTTPAPGTTLGSEDDEARIGLKINTKDKNNYTINLKRTDSESNFQKWITIKKIENQPLDELPIIFDNSIESGVFYKYALQKVDSEGGISPYFGEPTRIVEETRDNQKVQVEKVIYLMREFEHSYLVGESDGKIRQLKLKFNNTISSYRQQVNESKNDTIGGVYPIVTRNSATYYKTFSISGLISLLMDDNKLFYDKLYNVTDADIIDQLDQYSKERGAYNYPYEKRFRDKVIKFLYDGKYKLFKSPTEGNIIVRLTDISFTPNQSLGRMIYNFSCNAHEMAEATFDNLIKYGLYSYDIEEEPKTIPSEEEHSHHITIDPSTPEFEKKLNSIPELNSSESQEPNSEADSSGNEGGD